MFTDIEEMLGRELREVAADVQVPALPDLPGERPRAARHWQPLLVAAAVVLIIAGAIAVAATVGGGRELQPAPPSPSPSRAESADEIPTTSPTVPYVVKRTLFVDGTQVPGTWWSVESGEQGWLAQRTDDTWWWGRGPEAMQIEGELDQPPVLSPNGQYVGEVITRNGKTTLSGFDTDPAGQGFGDIPVDDGSLRVRAVTDDGRVIAQGDETGVLWLPLVDNDTVDLTDTAPGQVVLQNTAAGLVVNDGTDGATDATIGAPYLAEISDAGELAPTGTLPLHHSLVVSPGAEWLAFAPLDALGGEVASITTLSAQTVDGSRQVTLTAPTGWGFVVQNWVWEDDEHLVSAVVRDGGNGPEAMARCGVQSATCVLIEAP